MGELDRLQAWYLAQCDGDWEHGFGVSIQTLDNPGWQVTVDLKGTSLADLLFLPVARGVEPDEADWVHCKVEGHQFLGHGGAENLGEILRIFLEWAGALVACCLTTRSSGQAARLVSLQAMTSVAAARRLAQGR
jgi:hypothetical protein